MSEQKQEQIQSFDIKCEAELIKQVFKSAHSLCEEITVSLTPEGMIFTSMDPQHVALIDCRLPNTLFEKYEVNSEIKLGLRLEELNKILDNFNTKDYINLSINLNNELRLSNKSMTYNLRLIESSATDCPLPKISYNSKLSLNGYSLEEFKKTLKNLSVISEYVTFKGQYQKFELEAKGDCGSSSALLERGMPNILEIDHKEELRSTYSLEYITAFLKTVKKKPIILELSSKMPLRIEVTDFNQRILHFYLAPRVEN